MNAEIFKAYDIRGKVGSQLNKTTVWQIGRALAAWLPGTAPVAVGRDMRPDSEALAKAMAEGLRAGGRDVWDIGQVTSDMIYFAVGSNNLSGGAMITASHNPGTDNGIKLCGEGAKPIGIDTGLFEIRDLATKNEYDDTPKQGNLEQKDLTAQWINHVLSFVNADAWPAYKVAIDAGNGMAGAIIPHLQPKVPLHVTPLYFELDGTFPNHIANPLEPKNLVDLQKKVAEANSDFGIAFDGDGDRAVLIDEKGQALSGTAMTAILAKHFLKLYPGATILYNLICSRIVPDTIKENGGIPQRTRVGHSYIKADMRTYKAVFAGEHSGHYYFKDNFNADSGLIAVLVAIQVLAESGKKLSELADEYRKKYVVIPETNFEVSHKAAALAHIKAAFNDGQQDELDGLTVNYDDGWLNVRPSNTEPLLRLNAEATTKGRLDELVARARQILEAK